MARIKVLAAMDISAMRMETAYQVLFTKLLEYLLILKLRKFKFFFLIPYITNHIYI